jgi:hypothetical protein
MGTLHPPGKNEILSQTTFLKLVAHFIYLIQNQKKNICAAPYFYRMAGLVHFPRLYTGISVNNIVSGMTLLVRDK